MKAEKLFKVQNWKVNEVTLLIKIGNEINE